MERSESGSLLPRLLGILFWIVFWQGICILHPMPLFLPSPAAVAGRLSELYAEPDFWLSLAGSSGKILCGLFLGFIAGTAAGGISVRSRTAQWLLEPLAAGIRSIPVVSLIILLLISFSSRNLSIAIVFLIVFPVFYDAFRAGVNSQDRKLLEMADHYGVSGWKRFRYLTLPAAAPFLCSAGETAAGLSWKAGAAAEVIGMPARSIGAHLQQAKLYLDTPALFAWTIMLVLLSMLTAFLQRQGWRLLLRSLGIRQEGGAE